MNEMNRAALTPGALVSPSPAPLLTPGGQVDEVPLVTRYLRVALRWKWVIAAIIAGSLALGVLATMLMTRQYTATTTVEISRSTDKVVQIEGVEQESTSADLEFYQSTLR